MPERARVRWVARKSFPGAWEVLWVDLNGKGDSATFRVEPDPDERYDARGRRLKPRPIETIKQAREKEAIQLQTQVNARLAEGRSTNALSGRSKTYREVAERMQAAEAHALENKTKDGYADAYRLHIFPTFGSRPIHSISSMDVEEWWAETQTKRKPNGDPYSVSSLNGLLVALGKVFKYAMRHGLVERNPVSGTRRLREIHRDVEFYTPEEIAALLDELSLTPPYDLLVRFACMTGLRPGELQALRVGDIDFAGRQVFVRKQRQHTNGRGWEEKRTKTLAANREVPLDDRLLAELRRYLATVHPRSGDPSAHLWPGREKGGNPAHTINADGTDRRLSFDRPMRCEGIYRSHVLPALRERGLRELDWYSFRHFYASWCAAQGYRETTVAKWMGHTNVNIMYKHYLHLFRRPDDTTRLGALYDVTPTPRPGQLRAVSGDAPGMR